MKQKKVIKKLLFILVFVFIIFGFYKINELNYKKYNEIQANLINHPEGLPKIETAKATSFGFKNLRADIYWLQTIQYIGGNALGAEYKKYLYQILDLITELNPFFEHPYIIGQLLLPDYNERYEKLSIEEQTKYKNQAEEIGLKGIKNFCDLQKIEKIKNEDDLQKIWTNKEFKNPCKSFQVPFYLGYIYYFYKNDPVSSSLYYKITSANEDSLEGAKIMAAIMQGKGGNREKSIFMFLTLARSTIDEKTTDGKMCLEVVNGLEKITYINGTIIKNIENTLKLAFGKFDEKKENKFLDANSCQNYTNKAAREINLFYLDQANQKYKNEIGKNAKDSKELLNKGYIDYEPKDFQQYDGYGIVYKLNEKTGYFDYEMENYGNIPK